MRSQITPAAFEKELREGRAVTVVDIRDPREFADWRVDPGSASLVNLPSSLIRDDPVAAAAALRADQPVRVMCTRGLTAVESTDLLRAAGLDASIVSGGMIGWSRVLVPQVVVTPSPATIVQFRREARGCLSYLLARDGDAIVVDPAPDVAPYLEQADRLGATIRVAFDTHIHADHLSGAGELVERVGATRVISRGAEARGARFAHCRYVGEGDRLALGASTVAVIELPGHTSDNVGLLVDACALVAGDSLFADSVARPDLEVGDEGAASAAAILHGTLRDRVFALPDETVLLPCHYAGGRRDAPIAPTLGAVRREVPVLSLERDDFVDKVLAAMPPRPANYLQIIAVNRDGLRGPDDAGLEVGANNCAASAG